MWERFRGLGGGGEEGLVLLECFFDPVGEGWEFSVRGGFEGSVENWFGNLDPFFVVWGLESGEVPLGLE